MSVPMTKLVGAVSDPAYLAAFAQTSAHLRPVDLVEVRLDQVPRDQWSGVFASCDLLEASSTPVLATIRLRSDGGVWEPDDRARVDAFRQVIRHASWIDVEVGSAFAQEIAQLAHDNNRHVVVSYHNFERTPSGAELEDVYDRARKIGADIVKISTMVDDVARGHDTLNEVLRNHRDGSLCVIGMGAKAVSLRMYLPAAGSALAYSYLDRSSAPGQLSAQEMLAHLTLTVPGFHDRRINAHR